jgi:hypothetical protein
MLQRAIERIENKETGGLVACRLDRFGRSLADALVAVERIGVELLGLDRGRTGGPGRDRVLHR